MSKTQKHWLNTKPHTAEHTRRNIFLGLAAASVTYFLVNPFFADLAQKFYGTTPSPTPIASPVVQVSPVPSISPSPSLLATTPTPKPRPKVSPSPRASIQPAVSIAPKPTLAPAKEEADPFVECHQQPECGGGSQIVRESECNRTGCCPIAPGKYETMTEAQCKQRQIDYANQNGNPW